MDHNENLSERDISFGEALGKSFLISTATSVGVLTGMLVVGFTLEKIRRYRDRKAQVGPFAGN